MAPKASTTEAPVEDKTPATPETDAPATETPVEETPIDISAFTSAVEAAVEEADESTGTVPEATVGKVREAYQALDGVKPKNAAKTHLQDLLKKYLTDLQVTKSRAIMQLTEEAAVAGKSSSATKAPVDPTEAYVNGLAVLTLALYLAQSNVPEGVDKEAAVASATEKANGAFAEAQTVAASEDHKTDNALISAALRVATSKAKKSSGPRVTSGERRDLGLHISEAFAAVEPGTFLTVAEIRKFESTGYGSDHPSAGAITNRLKPKSGAATTVEGITVETRDGKLGAVKNAPVEG